MSQQTDSPVIKLVLSKEEIGLYTNVLNEILNGLEIRDFQGRISTSREAAEALLRRLGDAFETSTQSQKRTLSFRLGEIRTLEAGFLTCMQELGAEEMPIRTGLSLVEAERHVFLLNHLWQDAPTLGVA